MCLLSLSVGIHSIILEFGRIGRVVVGEEGRVEQSGKKRGIQCSLRGLQGISEVQSDSLDLNGNYPQTSSCSIIGL